MGFDVALEQLRYVGTDAGYVKVKLQLAEG